MTANKMQRYVVEICPICDKKTNYSVLYPQTKGPIYALVDITNNSVVGYIPESLHRSCKMTLEYIVYQVKEKFGLSDKLPSKYIPAAHVQELVEKASQVVKYETDDYHVEFDNYTDLYHAQMNAINDLKQALSKFLESEK